MSDNPRMEVPDTSAGERAAMVEQGIDVQLSEQLARLRDRITAAFDDVGVSGFRGELTIEARPARLLDLLRFCRDDPDVACELLADVNGVHWLGGVEQRTAQETTGWPTYEVGQSDGRIDVDYVLYSIRHNHRLRIRVAVTDDHPRLDSATGVYRSADVMEREVYDMFGVTFEGHPNLERILMPEDWDGHPLRKDYPLGGVEVQYKGATIPAPDQRQY